MTYKLQSHVKPPKARKPKACPFKAAFDEYAEAYKSVYGVSPSSYTISPGGEFIRIGASAGVSLSRLKELTRQLKRN